MSINTFTDYAKEYGVTVAEAIADRDWPMTKSECIRAFKLEEGRDPTDEEIDTMRPDGQHLNYEE